jgi:hypothetical protein
MSTIQDLTTAVTALTAAVAALPASGTTVLSPADQAELDSDVEAVNAATTAITADEPAAS